MWNYVFSPRLMMIDAVSALVASLLVRVVLGHRDFSKRTMIAVMVTASIFSHWYQSRSRGRSMPSGYVGRMAQACMQDESRERCLCAVDTLRERIGQIPLVKLGVRAEVNLALPQEFLDALAECPG
jgi:hypothetical protein